MRAKSVAHAKFSSHICVDFVDRSEIRNAMGISFLGRLGMALDLQEHKLASLSSQRDGFVFFR